jgi:5-methylcytosine-specific restriction endonuclease McrBC regulatory subunit McrC
MAIDDASKMRAIRKAIEILRKSSSNKNKTMNVNEMNYVIDTLKDIEKQLQLEQDERTGTA